MQFEHLGGQPTTEQIGDGGGGGLKKLVTEAVNEHLAPIRERRAEGKALRLFDHPAPDGSFPGVDAEGQRQIGVFFAYTTKTCAPADGTE